MNDILMMASYYYNNCELNKAIALLDRHPSDAEAAVLRIKCLYELDLSKDAVQFARNVQKDFPFYGLLHYHRGISLYLAGASTQEIEDAFSESLALGCQEAQMGMSFLAFVASDYDRAIHLLESVSFEDGEAEHSRMLKLFQIHLKRNDIENAEASLFASRRVLARSPSLLRTVWSDLCQVRLLRAKGQFEAARDNIDRLLAQIDPNSVRRLYRNARESRELIEQKDNRCHIVLPSGVPRLNQNVLNAISKKPVLYHLYEFLKSRGLKGASKEDIISEVWNETYNPLIHDDRLYKAVGRLRKLLGDDQDAPRTLRQKGRNYILSLNYRET